eukprot:TRINITY_DN25919_c0_g1_i2.p1 TRINITY_DN25919_c0_g1~~TRINITY_DN25919_c0_g1_i2.p1  ORF type:complete len:221 (+),score=35.83 TRINITY_DN25919_c0_g1_i2:3-665(+)
MIRPALRPWDADSGGLAAARVHALGAAAGLWLLASCFGQYWWPTAASPSCLPLRLQCSEKPVRQRRARSPRGRDKSQASGAELAAPPPEKNGMKEAEEKVFIDGDCIPPPFYSWLRELSSKSDVAVFVAYRKGKGKMRDPHMRMRSKLLSSGIKPEALLMYPSQTTSLNAADVILTFLFARYAGAKNYLVSDDRHWFKEVLRADPSLCTVWITSDKFRAP